MAQRPAELTPMASAQHFFGAELRHWRQRRGMSLARLGQSVFTSADLIGKIEKARRWPTRELVERCEAVLDSGGVLQRLHALASAERRPRAIDLESPDSGTIPVPVLIVVLGAAFDAASVLGELGLLDTVPMATRFGRPHVEGGAVIDIAEVRARRSVSNAAAARRFR